MSILNIFNQIEKKINNQKLSRAKVIGINGVDTSGKTMFASDLANFLIKRGYNVQQISIDDFHNHSSVRLQKYIPIQKQYLEKYSPKERSDIGIVNTDFNKPIIFNI